MSKRRIIPLPIYKINPVMHPDGLFKPKQVRGDYVDLLVLVTYPVCAVSGAVGSGPLSPDDLLL